MTAAAPRRRPVVAGCRLAPDGIGGDDAPGRSAADDDVPPDTGPARSAVGRLASALHDAPRGAVRSARGVTRTGRTVAGAGAGVARCVLRPAGVLGVAVESVWVATHLMLYPLGTLGRRGEATGHGYRIEHLPPAQRGLLVGDVEAAGTPIVLVHGLGDNRSVFTVLRRGLRRRGFGRVSTLNYSPLTSDVRAAAARLAAEVETIAAETGYERIHVIGHSLGGLIARYYVTRLGGDARVHTLVTLGTPHAGTHLARAWPSRLCGQLRPGSPLMRELEQPAPGCRTRVIAYWSDLDYAVLPVEGARLVHEDLEVRNIGLVGVGHMSLPIVPSVVRGISAALAQLDTAGGTVADGVHELPGPARRAAPA